MTSIVGILCSDGVVVGADSAATFGSSGGPTIEQLSEDKVCLIGDDMIVASTGQVGLIQRFELIVKAVSDARHKPSKSYMDVAKQIAADTLKDFASTSVPRPAQFTSFVAYGVGDYPWLCEFDPTLQPEFKKQNLWFTTGGNNQTITDSFLALLRRIFWADRLPTVEEGIFATVWTLQHVCEVNVGGVKSPIHIAVLEKEPATNKFRARKLEKEQLAEHENNVTAAEEYFSKYRESFVAKNPPKVPEPSAKT